MHVEGSYREVLLEPQFLKEHQKAQGISPAGEADEHRVPRRHHTVGFHISTDLFFQL